MHRHLVFDWASIPEPLEHHRCACTAAGGIDDQIGGQLRHPIAAVPGSDNAGDTIALRSGGHVDEIMSLQHRDVGHGAQSPTNVVLEERTAGAVRPDLLRTARPNAEMTVHTEVEPGQIAAVEARGAVCDELVEEPGNSSSKGLCPT